MRSATKSHDWLAPTHKQVAKAVEVVAREHCDAIITAAVERARNAFAEAQTAGAKLAVLAREGVIGEQHAALLQGVSRNVVVPSIRVWRDSVNAFRCDAERIGDPNNPVMALLPPVATEEAAWGAAFSALHNDADAELPA